MFKVIGVIVLAVQLVSFCEHGTFCAVAANSDPVAPGTLQRRDSSAFFASQVTLQNAAMVFAADHYSGAFPANVPELEGIAAHIKSCSDATDAAIIQLAALTPNLQAILSNLNTLQAGKAFFESVNNSPLLLTMFCHWIGGLSRQNDVFLGRLTFAAPSADYSSYWAQLQSNTEFQYQIWLTEDGFNCGGLY
ncbi:hypothetical protein DFH09DRAFT_191369 [Mycena vulgaris]|nr:hypothetical protein DFH09DRAFT_191369 [Mycena vulgaris]